jgi:hypothetical protein
MHVFLTSHSYNSNPARDSWDRDRLHNDSTVFPERKLTQADRSALNRRNAQVSWFPMVCKSPHSNPMAQLMLPHKVVKAGT